MLISSKEREKLNKSILNYLNSQNLNDVAEIFAQESNTNLDQSAAELEKKWGAVVRLQQKVMQLTNELNQLKEEMSFYGRGTNQNDGGQQGIPRVPEKFTLTGHRQPITNVSFHPVYSVLASTSEDNTIRLWDYESGSFERAIQAHSSTVNCVVFEPNNGNIMASCGADMTIKLWSFGTFECYKILHGHDHNVSYVEFVPNGDFLVSVSRDRSIKLWEIQTGFCTRTYLGHSDWVRQVSINQGGNLLASCSNDETVIIWNIESTNPLQYLSGHTNVVECVKFANYNAVEIIKESQYFTEGDNRQVEFVISGSRDKTIILWEASSGTQIYMFKGHDNWIRQVQFHPQGKYLYSVSDDKSIRLWDFKTFGCNKKIFDSHSHFVTCIGFNPRYPLIATGGVDKVLKIWECR